MKRLLQYAAALLLVAPVLQSCGDDPASPTQETKITFTQGAEATYSFTRLDTTVGRENQPMEDGRDTIRQQTIKTDASIYGKTNVVFKENRYVVGGEIDSAYFWQADNGDLYQYNFGLDLINSPAVQAVINQPIASEWVLVAKMGEVSGHQWTALDTTLRIEAFGVNATIKSVAKVDGDVTLRIDGKDHPVRKFTHTLTATTAGGGASLASTTMIVFVSREHGGIVKTTRDMANITIPFTPPAKVVGADVSLLTYTKP